MNEEQIIKGEIPWTIEGFQQVNVFLADLLKQPKDDWDLTTSNFPLNMFDPMGQVAKYFRRTYGVGVLWKAHFIRYNNIIRFLQEHKESLIKKKFLADNQPMPLIKDRLLRVLCRAPFTEKRFTPEGSQYVLAYADVMRLLR